MSKEDEIVVAVAGNPNSGKTTIFNEITGSAQKVGNWTGVTVEKLEGIIQYRGKKIRFIDLPGTYSLSAYSPEERIARDFLLYEFPDVVLLVIDASNIERNLYLVAQVAEIGHPMVVALNMFDIAEKEGLKIDVENISQLIGSPVVPTIGTRGTGIPELLERLLETAQNRQHPKPVKFPDEVEDAIVQIEDELRVVGSDTTLAPRCHIRRYVVEKLLEGDENLIKDVLGVFPNQKAIIDLIDERRNEIEKLFGSDINSIMAQARFAWASGVFKETVSRKKRKQKPITERIDDILLNRWLGLPIFAVIMFVMFYLTFTIGGFFADYLDMFFGWFAQWAAEKIILLGGSQLFASLIADGVISGVGGVLVFLPNIAVLFILIGFLEDSGYIARAAFLMDKIMHKFGLHGQSFIPMLIGFGCSVPAVMATRSLRNHRDRITTALILPFIPCSARLPVLILFAGLLFPKNPSIIVFSMYFLGIAVAFLVAFAMKKIFWHGLSSPFVIELPKYHKPVLRIILRHSWLRIWAFIKKAGTIILLGAILLWILGNTPIGVKYASEQSTAGMLGKSVAPIFSPQKIEWQGVVALIFGFIAKEMVVSSLGVLYGTGEENLSDMMNADFPFPVALAFLVFAMLYTPCIATLAAIKSETGRWRWVIVSVALSLSVAWVFSFIAYQIAVFLS